MQPEVRRILEENFPAKELFISTYYRTCDGYAISDKNECYILERDTNIDFNIAALAFVRKEDHEICIFVTAKKYRRQGFGKNLLTCINEQYTKTSLWVRVSNTAAINLYKNVCGYQVDEFRENFYEYTGLNEGGFHMVKVNN